MERNRNVAVVILTALRDEYLAVRFHLKDLQEVTHPQGTVYEVGKFLSTGKAIKIAIVEIGEHNPNAAFETERAIRYFNPIVVFFIGIAGGIKDVDIGDVVAATKIYMYESGKYDYDSNKMTHVFLQRPEVLRSTYKILQRARAEARKENWLKRIEFPPSTSVPRVFLGPIAAGEKIVASTTSEPG